MSAKTTASLAKLGVSAVAPGVWRAALPFPSPLVYSFCYVLSVDDGYVAVDLGWDSDESWELFRAVIDRAGGTLDQLVGVVVTHAHPDHYGLARRVRAHTGAWLALHEAERPALATTVAERRRRVSDLQEWLVRCGAPAEERDRLQAEEEEIASALPSILPDVLLADAQPVPQTAGRIAAIHTPGHTPGHLCFEDREQALLFTGDHVLPRITPNVSKRPTSDRDPLRDYAASVSLLRGRQARLVLPGHEWAFDRLDDRLDAILSHHQARLDEVETVVHQGRATVWEIAEAVSWSRPFGQLNGRAIRSALGETWAHLQRLTALGRINESDGQPPRWRPVEARQAIAGH
jgi:glyoxylase-like metal-dependent hydrolase (beta-lactamase superfamily II)